MENIDMAKVKRIMGAMECPTNFKCTVSGSDSLCEVKDFGATYFLQCKASKQPSCSFSIPYAFGYLCSCPLRVYIGGTEGAEPFDLDEQQPGTRDVPIYSDQGASI